ncbi:hypothetical protein GCM10028821_11140 [Hymenobacter jeollabukensis]
MAGWVPATPSLTKERARSGLYSIKTDKDIEYSLTYRQLLADVVSSKPRKLRLTGWVNTSGPDADAILSLQILSSKDGSTVFNEGVNVKEQVKKPGSWQQVSHEFVLPEKAISTDELRVFLWRAGSGAPVYLDDVELQLVE